MRYQFNHSHRKYLSDEHKFIEAIDEVNTTFFIYCLLAAFKALIVAYKAGLIRFSSSFGSSIINGDATCIKYSQSDAESIQP